MSRKNRTDTIPTGIMSCPKTMRILVHRSRTLQQKNNRSSSSSSKNAVNVLKPPKPAAVPTVSTRSLKRPLCSDDSQPVIVKGRETKSAKRQRRSIDIQDGDRMGGNKVDGGLGLRTSSESTCSSEYSGSLSCRESPLTVLDHVSPSVKAKATICAKNEMNLSPERGARVATLLARFSGIIVKSQRDVLGITTTEADYRDAEIKRANNFVKQQRQRDREAARLALSEMEKKVVIDDNMKMMKEFEMLISGQGHLLV